MKLAADGRQCQCAPDRGDLAPVQELWPDSGSRHSSGRTGRPRLRPRRDRDLPAPRRHGVDRVVGHLVLVGEDSRTTTATSRRPRFGPVRPRWESWGSRSSPARVCSAATPTRSRRRRPGGSGPGSAAVGRRRRAPEALETREAPRTHRRRPGGRPCRSRGSRPRAAELDLPPGSAAAAGRHRRPGRAARCGGARAVAMRSSSRGAAAQLPRPAEDRAEYLPRAPLAPLYPPGESGRRRTGAAAGTTTSPAQLVPADGVSRLGPVRCRRGRSGLQALRGPGHADPAQCSAAARARRDAAVAAPAGPGQGPGGPSRPILPRHWGSGQRRHLHQPPRANRKPVLRVLTAQGAPLAFAKLGVNPLTSRLVVVRGRRPLSWPLAGSPVLARS